MLSLLLLPALGVPESAGAQAARVRGTVRAEDGTGLAGAEVRVADALQGALTDGGGNYVLALPASGSVELRVRAEGYRSGRRRVDVTTGETSTDFELAPDPNRLDEALAAGMLTPAERATVPFAVTRIDVAVVPVPQEALRLLAGRVPNATVTSVSGRPGATPDVVLRGTRGLTPRSAPLILVDGVIAENGTTGLNPADVERVEVLSGVAAAAWYGTRAGSGAIHITTRHGRSGDVGVTVRAVTEFAASDVEHVVAPGRNTMLLLDERNQRFCIVVPNGPLCSVTIDWQAEAARVNNEPGALLGVPSTFPVTPALIPSAALANLYQSRAWPGPAHQPVAEMLRTGAVSRTDLDVSVRGHRFQAYGSVSRLAEPGALRFLEGYERYAGRLNAEGKVGRAWTVSLRSFASVGREAGRTHYDGMLSALSRQPAVADVFARDTLGRRFAITDLLTPTPVDNPVALLENIRDDARTERYTAGVGVRFAPYNWLEVAASFDVDEVDFRRSQLGSGFRGPFTLPTFVRRQSAWSRGVAAAFDVTARRRLGRELSTTTGLRVLRYESDEHSRWRQGRDTTLFSEQEVRVGGSERSATLGTRLEYRDRYVVDALIRREGLGDPAYRVWETSGRVATAWRATREPWWFAPRSITDLSVRAAWGSSTRQPRFRRLYELDAAPAVLTFGRPAGSVEIEVGVDAQVLGRVGVSATHARTTTDDQLVFLAPPSFGGVLVRNVGIAHRAWDLSVDIPAVSRPRVTWSWRLGLERIRSTIDRLDGPPFIYGGPSVGGFLAAEGEPLAAIYGRRFVTDCAELPRGFQSQCGDGRPFQRNDDGLVVWVGNDAGGTAFSWRDGITRNLWGTRLQGFQAPWGAPLNWGAPIVVRDTLCVTTPSPTCPARLVRLGSSLPDWQFSVATSARWRRFSLSGLLQGSMGREVWNRGRHWMYLELLSRESDQSGRSVETAKPVGYYGSAGPADESNGYGGLTDVVPVPNSYFIESVSYAKLRELAVSCDLGQVVGFGRWSVSLIGRNLVTFTSYRGFDPEVPFSISGQVPMWINATDGYTLPNLRTLGVSFSVRF